MDIWTIVRITISTSLTRDASGDHYEPRGHFFMDVEDRTTMEGSISCLVSSLGN